MAGMATSMCKGTVSDRVIIGIESMINDGFNQMEKSVATPHPNKEIRALSLKGLPEDYGFFESDQIRVERRNENGIRLDILGSGFSKWQGYLKYCKGEKHYDYFDKLLNEVNL